jgi:predicted dehydrogenase
MNILIVGSGSIAIRHAKNIRALVDGAEITILRSSGPKSSTGEEPAIRVADHIAYCLEDALAKNPTIALICCATSAHVNYALMLAKHGIHIFVEKPLSHSRLGLDELEAAIKDNKLTFLVGYNFRFSKTLACLRRLVVRGEIGTIVSVRIEAGQYLPEWRGYDYRQTTSAHRELGGGVVLELSHELDYFCWIFGAPSLVYARLSRRGSLEIDVEDTADIMVETVHGVVGMIHLNMIQKTKSRTCEVVGTNGSLTWNGVSDEITGITRQGKKIEVTGAKDDSNQMYVDELRYFLACVDGLNQYDLNFERERQVVEFILAVKESASKAVPVKLLG